MLLLSHGISDIGLLRANNEDVWIALPEFGFFALADGMGGHKAGEVAARETIEQLSKAVQAPRFSLLEAIERANAWVFKESRQALYKGMGTTLCCLHWTATTVTYAHVGDSRIYRFRNDQLELLTQDHSLHAKLLSSGLNSKTPYPYKNVITRAIGTAKHIHPEITSTPFEPGDLFLLCSDGLSDALPLEDMEKIIQRSETLELMASRLIEKAKIKGSRDNITALLVKDGTDLLRQQLHDGP